MQQKENNKAQVAMEFLILVNMVFLLLLVFTVAVREHSSTLNDEEEYRRVKDMAYSIADEISAATIVNDGFEREFTVLESVGEYIVSARIENDIVTVNSTHHEYSIPVPHVEGQLTTGQNTLIRREGNLYLN